MKLLARSHPGIHGPEPVGPKFEKSRTEPDQDQKNLENLGPSRTDRSSDQAVRGSLVASEQSSRVWDSHNGKARY